MAEDASSSTILVLNYVPRSVCVVAGDRVIVCGTPLEGIESAIRAAGDIKSSVGLTPNSDIGLAVTVIIILNVEVRTGQAKNSDESRPVGATQDVPDERICWCRT